MPVKSIPVQLDKKRSFRFDYNALCALEEAGLSVDSLERIFPTEKQLKEGTAKVSFIDMRSLIWAGLLHEDKELTFDDVGDILSECEWMKKADVIGEALGNAITSAFPSVEGGTKNVKRSNPKKQLPGRN